MLSAEVANRYAAGLFQLAKEKNIVDQIAEEIKAIGQVCRTDRAFLNFLAAPQIREQEKEEVLHSVFKGRVSPPVMTFLDLIIGKRRSAHLVEIAEKFNDLVLDSRGFVKTRVVTAVPLGDKEAEALKQKLEKKTGKKILMTKKVDPAILGGVIVYLGNQVIDKSIKYQLALLREKLHDLKVN